jgi:hydrophobic/amphiphilic exporter-1 (mainly G- bacteria), HAE1 family
VERVVGINRFLQQSVLRRVATVVMFLAAAIGLTYLLMPPVEYLPPGNRNLVTAVLLPPPGCSVERSLEFGNELETATRPYWDLDPTDPRRHDLEYPQISDYFFVARSVQIFMGIAGT